LTYHYWSENLSLLRHHEVAVYSLQAICKAHDVVLKEYLNDVIARLNYKKATHEQLLNLLPHKWKLQHPEVY